MTLIERATQALAASLHGEAKAQAPSLAERERLGKAVHAVLASLRDPDEHMMQAGAEIIRNVREAESHEAHLNDAANTWRFMLDALLAEK